MQHRIALRQVPAGTSQSRYIIATRDRDRHRPATAIACRDSKDITNNLASIQLILRPIRRVAPLATTINRKTPITTHHSALGHHTGSGRIKINKRQEATRGQNRIALYQVLTRAGQSCDIIAASDTKCNQLADLINPIGDGNHKGIANRYISA